MKNNQSNLIKSHSEISFIEMMKFSKSNIINRTITLFVLSCYMLTAFSCSNQSSSIEKESIEMEESVDISCELDMGYIKENALFYEDLAFLSDEYNHVIQIENDQIVKYYRYPLVSFHAENYDKVIGMDLYRAVEYIGCPTYIGKEDELSLDYSDYDGYLRRLSLEKQDEKYIIKDIQSISKMGSLRAFFDQKRISKPSLEQAKKLKVGMCIDDVVSTIGKLNHYKNLSSGITNTVTMYMDNGKLLTLCIYDSHLVDCEHIHHSYEGRENYFYYQYLYDLEIEGEDSYSIKQEPVTPYVTNDERFMDESKITIDYLKDQHCFFFDNMVFASDKKNHVFFIEDNKIKEHKMYDKIAYPKDARRLFKSVIGMNILDTFEKIGIPTYLNHEGGFVLDYSLPYGRVYHVSFVNEDGAYIVSSDSNSISRSDKLMPYNWPENRESKVNLKDIELIKKDMCIDEVVSIIGKPNQNQRGNLKEGEYFKASYILENDQTLEVVYRMDFITKECEHARISNEIYLNAIEEEIFGRNLFYLYVDSVSVTK